MWDGIPIRRSFDLGRVNELCQILIDQEHAKMLADEILAQIDSGYLSKKTYSRLSRWVNPEKAVPDAQPIAESLSFELFGIRISRVQE